MIKTLAVLCFLLVGTIKCAPKRCNGCTQPTGTPPKPIDTCNGEDKCAIFGGFRKGNFRLSRSDPSVILTCLGYQSVGVVKGFSCFRCPENNQATNEDDKYLYFSEKCNACMRNKDDKDNVCPTPGPTGTTTPLPPYNSDFCEHKKDGNHGDSVRNTHYYACGGGITYYMPCVVGTIFNTICNACVSPDFVLHTDAPTTRSTST